MTVNEAVGILEDILTNVSRGLTPIPTNTFPTNTLVGVKGGW